MIKLPDFSRCVELKTLLLNMGIREISGSPIVKALPEVKFERPCQKKMDRIVPNTEQLQFAQQLKTQTLSFEQFKEQFQRFEEDDSLEVNGVKCCAYIKRGVNKYHLFCCSTLKGMLNKGSYGKYVCTSRDDGWFPVFRMYSTREEIMRLPICKNCVDVLVKRDMYQQCCVNGNFSLKLFFQKYQPEIPKTTIREEFVMGMEEYAPSHQELADRYKKECKYKCDICRVDLSAMQRYLHMHHIDRNKLNNKRENLMILCVSCHSEQPFHAHMKQDPKHREGFQQVPELRKAQGIYSIG